jgi:TniQ
MTSAAQEPRPLTRTLEPLDGESLAGHLLRLSCRLHVSPLQLARLTGCAEAGPGVIARRLLLDLDIPRFALVTRLSAEEASALTIASWADRYPPITRSAIGKGPPVVLDNWLFAVTPRFCPGCLAGDGSPIQQQYGGPWRKTWQLPVAFACPLHRCFLSQACPARHPGRPGAGTLIEFPAAVGLHPAQCRSPMRFHKTGPGRPACGSRLDQLCDDDADRPSQAVLGAQQRLLDLLSPQHPAEEAARAFTDLRLISALLCSSWPLARELMDPRTAAAADDHVGRLSGGVRHKSLDTQPDSVLATAGLLTAAVSVLDSPDLAGTVARHFQGRSPGRPSRASWARVTERHRSACSPAMLEAADSVTHVYRRTSGPHSPRAPSRAGLYRPEHVPALLEQRWHDKHFASLGYPGTTTMRRGASVLLVQTASGGSLGDAARYLGIPTGRPQHSFGPELARWLADHGTKDFTTALLSLAAQLDDTPGLVNYQNRRQAMQEWCLDTATWQYLTSRLPPVPGYIQPVLDDRKRQEASAFVWARVTQGEPRFAPRPIEAGQPEPVRRDWAVHRANTWSKLARPGRIVHYAELRKLLIEHADHLAARIDRSEDIIG